MVRQASQIKLKTNSKRFSVKVAILCYCTMFTAFTSLNITYMSDFDNVSIKPEDYRTFLHLQEPDVMVSTTNIYCPFGI